MFYPKDHILVSDLLLDVGRVVADFFKRNSELLDQDFSSPEYPYGLSKHMTESFKENIQYNARNLALERLFFQEVELNVVQVDGTVLNVAQNTMRWGKYPEKQSRYRHGAFNSDSGYYYFDMHTSMLNFRQARKYLVFDISPFDEISLELFISSDNERKALQDELDRRSRINRLVQTELQAYEKLENCPLVIRKDQIPEPKKLSRFVEECIRPETQRSAARVGRPRKEEEVLRGYDKVFPFGHKGRTWKTVVSELEKQGTYTSQTALSRALKLRRNENRKAIESPPKSPKP